MRAKISPTYQLRVGAIALFCIGFAFWFFYDGKIGYPAQREKKVAQVEAYQQLEETGLDDVELRKQWSALAKERGWSPNPPNPEKTAEHIIKEYEGKITSQYVMGCLVLVPGVLYLFFFAKNWGRWVEMDDAGVRANGGRQFTFTDIVTLDKKKWDAKGIAKIRYQRDGRRRTLVLDDWKFETEPIRQMLRHVEAHISVDQITGGAPEPPLDDIQAGADDAGRTGDTSSG